MVRVREEGLAMLASSVGEVVGRGLGEMGAWTGAAGVVTGGVVTGGVTSGSEVTGGFFVGAGAA